MVSTFSNRLLHCSVIYLSACAHLIHIHVLPPPPEYILQNLGVVPDLKDEDVFSTSDPGYVGSGRPELPPRYDGIILPNDWYIPGKTRRRKRQHRASHGKISFSDLSKSVSTAWRNSDNETKLFCAQLADIGNQSYKKIIQRRKSDASSSSETAKKIKKASTKHNTRTSKKKRDAAAKSTAASSSSSTAVSSPQANPYPFMHDERFVLPFDIQSNPTVAALMSNPTVSSQVSSMNSSRIPTRNSSPECDLDDSAILDMYMSLS